MEKRQEYETGAPADGQTFRRKDNRPAWQTEAMQATRAPAQRRDWPAWKLAVGLGLVLTVLMALALAGWLNGQDLGPGPATVLDAQLNPVTVNSLFVDLDGDGDLDLLVSGQVIWNGAWLLEPDPTPAPPTTEGQ